MTKLSDRDLMIGFETATLGASEFNHADHVRVARLYLRAYPFFEAASRMRAGLMALSRAHGAAHRYHETITLAFLALVHERAQLSDARDFAQFVEANPDLMTITALQKLYSADRLALPLARAGFILPDRREVTR